MIRSELIQKIADENPHLYQRDVERIVNAIFEEIIDAMARGDRVELRGFGAFSVKKRDARRAATRAPARPWTSTRSTCPSSRRASSCATGSTASRSEPCGSCGTFFLALLAIALLIVALANRNVVTLTLLPEEIASFAGYNAAVSLPLFLVIFAGIVAGVVIGFVWEWFREHKHRAEAVTNRREREKLEREVSRLKPATERQTDDVLALLESGGSTR